METGTKHRLRFFMVSVIILINGCTKEKSSIVDPPSTDGTGNMQSAFNVTILSPEMNGFYYKDGAVRFQFTASDSLDVPLTLDSIQWSSDKDGIFYRWKNDSAAAVFPTIWHKLSVGNHVVTITAYDGVKKGYQDIRVSVSDEDTSAFVVTISSPEHNGFYHKTTSIDFTMEAKDSIGNLLIIDSLQWSTEQSGVFFRWVNTFSSPVFPHLGTSLPVGNHIVTVTVFKGTKTGYKKISVLISDSLYVKQLFESQKWSIYSLPTSNIYTMASDAQGGIVVGTEGSGIFYRKNNSWSSYTEQSHGLISNFIQTFSFNNSKLYVGHGLTGGIDLFDGHAWSYLAPPNIPNSSSNDVHAIAFDKSGVLFAGLHSGDIFSYNGVWTKITPDTLRFAHPGRLQFDEQGRLWGNSEHNYSFIFDGSNWRLVREMPATLRMVLQGNVAWYGSWGKGLYRFNGDSIVHFTDTNSGLPSMNVTAMTLDNTNVLWIGTSAGLVRYNGTTWTTLTPSNSKLPDGRIYSLCVDNQNQIWVGINNKVVRYKQ